MVTETDLVVKIQDLLEQSMYEKFQKEDTEFLNENDYTSYEQIEVTK